VAALLGEDPGHERQLLGGHEAVDRAIGHSEEVPDPRAHERLPGGGLEGVVGDRAPLRAAPLAAVVTQVDVVGRIGEHHRRPPTTQQALDILPPRRVAAQEAVFAERPQIAGLGPRLAGRGAEGGVEVEVLDLIALLADLETPEQGFDLVIAKAREAEVEPRCRAELGEHPSKEGRIPFTMDLIEAEAEESSPLDRNVDPSDWDGRQAHSPSHEEALIATDHRPVLSTGDDGLDPPELVNASFESVEHGVADAARVFRVGPQQVDRDLLYGEDGWSHQEALRGGTWLDQVLPSGGPLWTHFVVGSYLVLYARFGAGSV
jgi:hypothetical protein